MGEKGKKEESFLWFEIQGHSRVLFFFSQAVFSSMISSDDEYAPDPKAVTLSKPVVRDLLLYPALWTQQNV